MKLSATLDFPWEVVEEQEAGGAKETQYKLDLEARGGGSLPGISAPEQPAALTFACLLYSVLFLFSLVSFMQDSKLCVG